MIRKDGPDKRGWWYLFCLLVDLLFVCDFNSERQLFNFTVGFFFLVLDSLALDCTSAWRCILDQGYLSNLSKRVFRMSRAQVWSRTGSSIRMRLKSCI